MMEKKRRLYLGVCACRLFNLIAEISWRHIAGTSFLSNLEFPNRAGLVQSSLYTTLISFSKFLNESELE